MYEFKEDKINILIEDKFTSSSGKYLGFLGQHYNGVETCFDFGCVNLQTGEITKRHYKLEWECKEAYEQFKEDMRGTGTYEDDEPSGFTIIKPS